MATEKTYDHPLFLIILGLIGIGLVMVYSSSALVAELIFKRPPYYFLLRQACYGALGMVFLFGAMKLPYLYWRKVCYVLLVFTIFLLILVLLPWVGKRVGVAQRWLWFRGIAFQPAELAKFTLVVYMAHFLAKKAKMMDDWQAIFFPLCIIVGLSFLLIVKQPDFGTGVLLVLFAFSLLFVAGVKKRHLIAVILLAAGLLGLLVMISPYRLQRVKDFMNAWTDPGKASYQVKQSYYAFKAGGLTGLGLGVSHSIQKQKYLPEAHTDFIFSVLGEELGFLGTMAVLLLFSLFLWRGFRIARRTDDLFGRYLALGITMLIGYQALINICMTIGLLPTKGLALPFLSYGGSSLVVSALAAGVLLNISQST